MLHYQMSLKPLVFAEALGYTPEYSAQGEKMCVGESDRLIG